MEPSSESRFDTAGVLQPLQWWNIYRIYLAMGRFFSFLPRVAQFYVIISTAVHSRLNNKFAMKMGGQGDARYLPQDTLVKFAAEIGIDIRTVRAAFIRLMDTIETKSTQLAEEYRDRFGDLVILGNIARVISNRIAKGRELVQ